MKKNTKLNALIARGETLHESNEKSESEHTSKEVIDQNNKLREEFQNFLT